MNIAICDDSPSICADISDLIRRRLPDAKIFIFNTKESLLKASIDFDIFFLDVKAVDGIEIAKIIRRRSELLNAPKSILIFVTGYREYAAAAFDVNAFHYLIKPIDAEKFSKVLSQAVTEIKTVQSHAEKFLLIKVDGAFKKIYLRDILYIESRNKKVAVHTTFEIFEIYGKMDAYEIALAENFFRCHRCYIVNLEKISSYTADTIELTSGEKIFIAAKKYSDFVKSFLRYAKSGGLVNV